MIDTLVNFLLWWVVGAVGCSFLLSAYESVARPRDYSVPLDKQTQKDIVRAQSKFSATIGIVVAFIYYIVHSNRYINTP
jgi:hypothetical protein